MKYGLHKKYFFNLDKSSIEELEKNLLDTRNRLKYIESLNQQHEITMFKLKSQLLIYEKLGKSELWTKLEIT